MTKIRTHARSGPAPVRASSFPAGMEISMPDYTTRFSCRLDTGSTAMAVRAVRRFAAYQRLVCQIASKRDPLFASNFDPFRR
jgi:hypothetical protein